MARLTGFPLQAAQRVGRELGLSVASVEPLDAGSVNSNFRVHTEDGRVFFGRIYEEQGLAGATEERRLLAVLRAHGVPCAVPLSAASGAVPTHLGKPVAFYPWVHGELLCWSGATEARCAEVGRTLARIHRAPASEVGAGRFETGDLAARLTALDGLPLPESLRQDIARIRRDLESYSSERAASLPHGVIHGDLFRDNVLWHGERIIAVLDFESASVGSFAFDFMVAVHAWAYGDGFALDRVRALLDGYRQVRELTPTERRALRTEGALAALRFATTRITDFTLRCSAEETPKRDYRRFLRRLDDLEAGALDPVLSELAG